MVFPRQTSKADALAAICERHPTIAAMVIDDRALTVYLWPFDPDKDILKR